MSKVDQFLSNISPYTVSIWASIMIATLAGSLVLKGRFIGLGVAVGIALLRWGLPQIKGIEAFRKNYQLSNIVQLIIGIIFPCLFIWGMFYGLNFLPWIGDLGFRNYRGVIILTVAFLGLGFLILNEGDRQNKYMLPLIIISGLALIAFGITTVDYDYLLIVLQMTFGVILLWDWWFLDRLTYSNMSRSALLLALPISTFICSQIASQIVMRSVFPSGLMIQYFFALPGLFAGIFFGIYLSKFRFRKSSWIVVPLVPVVISIILGVEAGICYWMTLAFTLFLISLTEPLKVYVFSGFSLATTFLMYLLLPGMHIPYNLIGTDLRSALGVSIVVFWLIITLFSNQVRRDWSLEHLTKLRIRQRSSRKRRG